LNQRYLDPNTYIDVIDEQIQQSDYAGKENDIIPAADPQATLPQEKQTKVQLLMQLLSLGTLDPMQVTKYALEAGEIPNADHFLIQQPPADPNAQAAQADQQAKQQDMQMKQQLAQTQAQAKIQLENTKANSAMASQEQKAQIDAAAAQQQLHFKALEATIQARASIAANQQDLQHKAVSHVLDTAIKADAHHQKMAQQAQQLKGKEPK
jgi:hypothetical protein